MPILQIEARLQSSHLSHQYGIFDGKSQTSFSRNATRAGSEEGRLFSQATAKIKENIMCLQSGRGGMGPLPSHVRALYFTFFAATFLICSNFFYLQQHFILQQLSSAEIMKKIAATFKIVACPLWEAIECSQNAEISLLWVG